jgi:hypothetical protein
MKTQLKWTSMKSLVWIILLIPLFSFITMVQEIQSQDTKIRIASLSNGSSDENFISIRKAFIESNPGYDLTYLTAERNVEARDYTQVVFVQAINGITNQDVRGRAVISNDAGSLSESETIVGDILILNVGESMRADTEMGLLVFKVPEKPKNDLPSFIRPYWDPHITDVPGGCATEIDAYRRILLTWEEDVGNYIYHALNAHRVRMRDSFSHYHPEEGGFDEFYLVQMTEPGAKIITSEQTALITRPDNVRKSQIDGLMQEYELQIGDLVYIPRGVIHRGYGGVVAQVITVPGFIPGSEIGVDHHLRAINERLGLDDDDALPYNLEASKEEIIR